MDLDLGPTVELFDMSLQIFFELFLIMNRTCGLRIQDRFSKLAELAFKANLVSLFLKRTDLNIFC